MGKVAGTYRRRIAKIPGETRRLKQEAKRDLVEALRDTTEEELYDRTPLPVSGRMRRSVKGRVTADGAEAYYDTRVAPHAPLRIRKKGRSKRGGHDMEMQPGKGVDRRAGQKIRRRSQAALRRIHKA